MTADDSRRKVADLETLHIDLEPRLRDVYVEGRSDQQLFMWYFREAGISVSGVYAVDDRAEVPSDQVLAAGAEVGPRGRIVGLAHAASLWNMSHPGITCIVDADRSLLVPESAIPGLLLTDYAAIEGYLFQARPLDQFLQLVVGTDVESRSVIDLVTPALNDLYVVRAVLHLEGPNVRLIERFQRCCSLRRGVWEVNTDELISRSLAAAGASQERERVISQYAVYRNQMPSDPSVAIRGHDIAPMLIEALELRNDLAKPDVVERALRGCLNLDDLDDQPMFRALRARLT